MGATWSQVQSSHPVSTEAILKIEFICKRQILATSEGPHVPLNSEIVDMGPKKGSPTELYLVSNRIWYPKQDRVEVILMRMANG